MKPQLVDLTHYLHETKSIEPRVKEIKNIKVPEVKFDMQSLFNMVAILTLFFGIIFLIKRKEYKEKKEKDLEDRINKLKDIIEINNKFIL